MTTLSRPPRVILAGPTISKSFEVRRAIGREGALYQTAADGKECLSLVRQEAPDIVFLELFGTNVDCLETLRYLREEERSHETPVVVVSPPSESEARKQALEMGATEFLSLPVCVHEVQARLRTLMKLREVEHRLSEIRSELNESRTTDAETGALQRGYVEQRVAAEVKSARRHEHPLSIIAAHLDSPLGAGPSFDFGPYLRPAADALRNLVRDEDLVSRYDLAEFVVVLPHTDSYGSLILAERIRAAVEALPQGTRRISASVGVASCQRAEDFLRESPLDRALAAMGRAKEQGGNRVVKQD